VMTKINVDPNRTGRRSGMLTTELMVGLAIIGIAILPLAHAFQRENRYLRRCYERAVVMEIVDGELEIIRAGGWRSFTNGVQSIATTARAATNLPPGELRLTLSEKLARLEWRPAATARGGIVVREATLK
jgi:galactitol-specific phosphotransferase system IIC component